MNEILEIYDLDNNLIRTQERKEFYEAAHSEYAQTGKITQKVKTVRVLVMNSEGRIYLQKRSKQKKDNTGLYDKTIAGHISKGESPNLTVIRECAEELGFPVAIVSKDDFKNALHSTDLGIIGILRQVGEDLNFLSRRTVEGRELVQPHMTYFYMGYYDGALKFKDGEASGLETFSHSELLEELEQKPEKFTHDVQIMIPAFREHLQSLRGIP